MIYCFPDFAECPRCTKPLKVRYPGDGARGFVAWHLTFGAPCPGRLEAIDPAKIRDRRHPNRRRKDG